MTVPAGTPDDGIKLFFPSHAKTVDISAADFDCTQAFAVGYATSIYVGGTGDVVVKHFGDTTSVTYKAVPIGTVITGCIQTVVKTSTTATLMIARSL